MLSVKTRQNGSSDKYMVPVLLSAFRTLQELSKAGPLSLNDLTRRTGVSKSTVFRILTTLHQLGYVIRDAQRNYHVSPNLANLVSDQGSSDILRQISLPYMLQLRDLCGETVNLGKLELDKVVYLEVVPSEFALRLSERPGAQVSVHASALGKAILAFSPPDLAESLLRTRALPILTPKTIVNADRLIDELHRIKERGHAFDRGETSILATCVAAPILGPDGISVGAMSISGPASRFNPRRESAVLAALMKAAAEISRQLRERSVPSEVRPSDEPSSLRKRVTPGRKRATG